MVNDGRIGGSTPAYGHALALIGQFFNQQRARGITIAEIESGFLLQYFSGGDWDKPRVEAVHHTDVLELRGPFAGHVHSRDGTLIKNGNARDKTHPLFPMGYDTFFRVLGAKLDRKGGIGLTICELKERLLVTYWVNAASFVIRDQRRQAVSSRESESFNAPEMEGLIHYTSKLQADQMLVYQAALKVNPNDPLHMMPAAFLFEDDGQYANAERTYQTIASRMKNHPEAHYHVARLALMRGDRRAARAAIDQALKANDTEAAVWDLYGRILQSQNKLKEAVTAFERAVEIDPANGILHYHLAKGYEAQGRAEEAARELGLSVHQEAAPAWEIVAEQIAIKTMEDTTTRDVAPVPVPEVRVPLSVPSVAPARSAEPAAAADEPLAASGGSPEPEPAPFIPSLTTDFAELIPREQPFGRPIPTSPLAAPTAEQKLTTGQLTTFGDSPAPEDWPALSGAPPEQEAIMPPWDSGSLALSSGTSGSFQAQLQGTGTFPASTAPLRGSTSALPRQTGTLQSSGTTVSRTPSSGALGSQPAAPAPEPGAGAPPSSPAPANTEAVEIAAEMMLVQRELEATPDRADLHRKLGFLLAKQGRTAEAAAEFRLAIEASRTNL